jgi:hypothetical protein
MIIIEWKKIMMIAQACKTLLIDFFDNVLISIEMIMLLQLAIVILLFVSSMNMSSSSRISLSMSMLILSSSIKCTSRRIMSRIDLLFKMLVK